HPRRDTVLEGRAQLKLERHGLKALPVGLGYVHTDVLHRPHDQEVASHAKAKGAPRDPSVPVAIAAVAEQGSSLQAKDGSSPGPVGEGPGECALAESGAQDERQREDGDERTVHGTPPGREIRRRSEGSGSGYT